MYCLKKVTFSLCTHSVTELYHFGEVEPPADSGHLSNRRKACVGKTYCLHCVIWFHIEKTMHEYMMGSLNIVTDYMEIYLSTYLYSLIKSGAVKEITLMARGLSL